MSAAVPAPTTAPMYAQPPPAPAPTKTQTKAKPLNVFSNDGSFLERFQRNKMEEDDAKKQEEELKKKREFDARFKNRRKRPAPSDSADASRSATPESAPSATPAKKAKTGPSSTEPLSQYAKEVKSYASRSLQEANTHIGSRSLVR